MCLSIRKDVTQEIKDKFKKEKCGDLPRRLTFWKVYRVTKWLNEQKFRDFISGKNPVRPEKEWQLRPIWYYQKSGKILPGEIVSDRKSKDLSYNEKNYDTIEVGIHVYLDFFTANEEKHALQSSLFETTSSTDPHVNETFVVVPVTGYEEDFIAAGNNDAVFMKVHLSQKDYDRAIKELEESQG